MSFPIYLISLKGENKTIQVSNPLQFIEMYEDAPAKLSYWDGEAKLQEYLYGSPQMVRRRFEHIPGTDCYMELPQAKE